MPTTHLATLLLACATAVACSSATQRSGAPRSRAILLAEEIVASDAPTAYDAIARLRPEWLRRRGPISIQDPGAGQAVVYVNGMRHGSLGSLQGIRADTVEQMEYLDAPAATTRFGTGHGGGAIVVLTH